jgi:PTH1 family peptidyl-tRNA hydrolase
VAHFYRVLPEQILVAHDELDLSVGQVKLKIGGGNAGHNGLKDIQAQTGTADFWRLRLGIGHPRQSDTPLQAVFDYVLKPPSRADAHTLAQVNTHVLNAWDLLASHDMPKAIAAIQRPIILNS